MADAPKSATRVIGIDPGLNVTGYGIIVCRANEVELLEAGVIRMPRSHDENLAERLESLFVELR
jgi:crossover junction endodeoxyribonuclease RuvC